MPSTFLRFPPVSFKLFPLSFLYFNVAQDLKTILVDHLCRNVYVNWKIRRCKRLAWDWSFVPLYNWMESTMLIEVANELTIMTGSRVAHQEIILRLHLRFKLRKLAVLENQSV